MVNNGDIRFPKPPPALFPVCHLCSRCNSNISM